MPDRLLVTFDRVPPKDDAAEQAILRSARTDETPGPRRVPTGVARGLVIFVVAVVVVLAGGGFAVIESNTAPAPGDVLSSARHFVARQRTWTYTGATTTTSPNGTPGQQVVVTRTVAGSAVAGQSTDFTVLIGSTTAEYLAVKADPGVWVRSASATQVITVRHWVHAASYTAFESALLALAGPGAASGPAVGRAILVDVLSAGDILPSLVSSATHAHRHGSTVRTLDVTFAPQTALGALAGLVESMSGQIVVDGDNRPTHLAVTITAPNLVVGATYDVTWGAPVSIVAPAPATVIAEIPS